MYLNLSINRKDEAIDNDVGAVSDISDKKYADVNDNDSEDDGDDNVDDHD